MSGKRNAGILLLLLTAVGMSAAGCAHSGAADGIRPHSVSAPMPKIPAGLEKFYTQSIRWKDCGENLKCAKVTVPLDYRNPAGQTIKIAVKKRLAAGKAIGSLLVNPGGPGGSGQEMAAGAKEYFSDSILHSFDVLGFDPRGVGQSSPVDCLSDLDLGKILEASYPQDEAGEAQKTADVKKIVAGCKEKSGALLGFVGTENAARDMDVIRHTAGDPRLYYVGYSYGTSLGGTYARLFPENVGRMVLDGAVSPSATEFEKNSAQLKGFENSLDAYLKDCLSAPKLCPFKGSVEQARQKIKYILKSALRTPIPTSDPNRPATQSALMYGIITALYDNKLWPLLSQAFDSVLKNKGADAMMFLFDAYTGRGADGFKNNSMEANWAITCADTPAGGDARDWKEKSAQLAKISPVFGEIQGYDEEICANWPYRAKQRQEKYHVSLSAPVVVVGTTGDPATPYQWPKEFAADLSNSVLITWEGQGHTAYGRSTECVRKPIDKYLLEGTVPENLICPAK